VTVPPERLAQARRTAEVLGDSIVTKFPRVEGLRPQTTGPEDSVLARTWRPSLTVTGADGLPSVRDAGNVHRPSTALKLSLRLPPTADAAAAIAAIRAAIERDPPHGARVSLKIDGSAGWDAPKEAPWLAASLSAASRAHFGRDVMHMGEGGS